MKNIHIYSTPQDLAKAFAENFYAVTQQLDRDLNIAISGGSTPKLIFKYLADNYSDKIDWKRIHFYWVDERCVPPNDEESNYRMTYESLLKYIAIPDGNINRIKGDDDPDEEAINYSKIVGSQLRKSSGVISFDLVLLGMGTDGHTASIFPNQMHLLTSYKICEVARHPVSGQKRITLTGRVINNAKRVIFMVTGENKAVVVSQVLNNSHGSTKYPAANIQPQDGTLEWYLDLQAANLI